MLLCGVIQRAQIWRSTLQHYATHYITFLNFNLFNLFIYLPMYLFILILLKQRTAMRMRPFSDFSSLKFLNRP